MCTKMASENEMLTLFNIPWEQVLCKHFLPCFSLKEVFRLRRTCTEFRDLIDCYFSLAFTINTTSCSDSLSRVGFQVITDRSYCLKELVLCNSDWLSDDLLIPILQNNPNLHTVDFSNCLHISNSSLYTVGAFCRKVRTISLRGCVWVSGSGLVSLIVNKLPLERIDLCSCWDLSDEDIINLATGCRGIQYLMLNNIYGLTNRSISQLAHLCPSLVQLSVKGCWRLTDQAIKLVGEFCPKLRAIQVRECSKITEFGLAKMRARKVRIDVPAPPFPSERMIIHHHLNMVQ